MTEERRRERWETIGIRAWALIGVLILVAGIVEAVIYLWDALWPFVVALIVVVALSGPIAALERRGWSRARSTAVCYGVFLLVTALAGWLIVPPVYARIAQLVGELPTYVAKASQFVQELVSRGGARGVPSWIPQVIDSVRDNVATFAKDASGEMARTAAEMVAKALDILVKVLLGLLVAFYVLVDLPRLRTEIMRLAAARHRDDLAEVVDRISDTLGGWLRGTVIDSTVVGAMYVVVFMILGVPYGAVIGLIGGMLNFIPWAGPAVVLALSVTAGLFVSPWTALWCGVAVIVIRQLDDFFVAPRVMSEQVDLHPALVVFSLLAGATLFGFVGLLLAIPFAAVAKSLFVYFYEKSTNRRLATEDGVLFKRSDEGDQGETGSGGETQDTGPRGAGERPHTS